MPGESSRTIQYRKSADQALVDLVRAFNQIGSVESSGETTMTVTGKTRYGAQAVKLRVSVLERDETSCLLEIHSFADDIWGGGARKGTDKLITALEDPSYKPGCMGAIIIFATGVVSSVSWLLT